MQQDHNSTLSIGELAALSGLSPKALRLYADSSLLPPRHVDPFTGYRYYGTDQVERARLIAALRGIGMGLARIAIVCDLDPADALYELRSWWRQEEADARSRRATVDRLSLSLGQFRQENSMDTSAHTTSPNPADRIADARIHLATAEHQGLARPTHQDAVLAKNLSDGSALIAVADGFGTDDTLATRVVETFAASLEKTLAMQGASAAGAGAGAGAGDSAGSGSVPGSASLPALEMAWAAVEDLLPSPAPNPEERPSGATLTAALICEGRLHVAHIGDTRMLLVRKHHLETVTRDHTRLQSLVDAGQMTAEEAATHPDRAVLNRALSADAPTAPDLLVRDLRPGDLVLVASDGLHAVVQPAALAEILLAAVPAAGAEAETAHGTKMASGSDPKELADRLIDLALDAGGPDNIGVALARVG